jgi:hypothetical protein
MGTDTDWSRGGGVIQGVAVVGGVVGTDVGSTRRVTVAVGVRVVGSTIWTGSTSGIRVGATGACGTLQAAIRAKPTPDKLNKMREMRVSISSFRVLYSFSRFARVAFSSSTKGSGERESGSQPKGTRKAPHVYFTCGAFLYSRHPHPSDTNPIQPHPVVKTEMFLNHHPTKENKPFVARVPPNTRFQLTKGSGGE